MLGLLTPVIAFFWLTIIARMDRINAGAMVGSASYIAAPTAVRIALPEARPTFYLTGALGITFPFNLVMGIPLYFWFARLFAA